MDTLLATPKSAVPAAARIEVYETARDNGHRLKRIPVAPRQAEGQTPVVTIDPAQRHQTILGFGTSLTESSAYVLSLLPAAKREEVLRSCFDAETGNGYTFARTHINSCDFSLSNWSCASVADDFELKHFTMEPARRYVLPLVQDVFAIVPELNLIASPWSPPGWMKTNGEMNNGGKLRPECAGVYARFLVRYLDELTAAGTPAWAVTVQNEPAAVQVWDSCIYSGEEERDFVRDHFGPALRASAQKDVKLIVWDHNKDILHERAAAVLSDQKTAQYVWGIGLHWYGGEQPEQLELTHAAWPDKQLIFTEGCWEHGAKPGQWDRGERYAQHIINDLNHWVTAWVDWNLALDLRGGPNHVGNFCDASVLVDTERGEALYQTSHTYIGHFSRFIRPGAVRLGSRVPRGLPHLRTTACRNTDGSLVTVLLNTSEETLSVVLEIENETLPVTLPPRAIQTVVVRA